MFGNLFGPKHTFKDALLILEKGLRNGEITLREQPKGVVARLPVVERTSFQKSSQVYITAVVVSFGNVQWSDRVAAPSAH